MCIYIYIYQVHIYIYISQVNIHIYTIRLWSQPFRDESRPEPAQTAGRFVEVAVACGAKARTRRTMVDSTTIASAPAATTAT